MQNELTTLIMAVVGSILVLLFEYSFLRKDATERKKIVTAAVLSICLFAPLFIFQFFSAQIVVATMKQRSEVVRVDWYANLYAVSAMSWGWIWGTKVRPWLRDKLEGGG